MYIGKYYSEIKGKIEIFYGYVMYLIYSWFVWYLLIFFFFGRDVLVM